MDLKEALAKMGFDERATVEAFENEEDGEEYAVWKVQTGSDIFVLKKTTKQELSVYNTFLNSVSLGAPRLYKSVDCGDDTFILIEYIDGNNLRKCDRSSLTAALDALIYLQNKYWERRDLQNLCYGYEDSLHGRELRGKHLNDSELEKAYEKFLQVYATVPRTLCHDDLLPFNVRFSNGRAVLIDWEYAGILPYATSLARLIAHGEEDEAAFFYMKEEDKAFAIEYYFEHLIKNKGIAYGDYRATLDYFLLYEYCEWVMLGNKYGDTSSSRFKQYLAKAKQHLSKLK